MQNQMIKLSRLEPHFKGNARLVFVHPDDPDLLVKVPRPEWIASTRTVPNWKKRFKPLGANSVNMHELREIIRINPKPELQQDHMFTVIGLQQTDLGWGLIVRAEKSKDGSYAVPVADFVNDMSKIEAELNEFYNWVVQTKTVLYDLNPYNLVLAYRNGKNQIVVIDGISEKSALQSRTYFQSINCKKNKEVYARFLRQMERIRLERQ